MDKLKPGFSFRHRGHKGLYHIRGIVDEHLVIRFWLPRMEWRYCIKSLENAELFILAGHWHNFRKSRDWRQA